MILHNAVSQRDFCGRRPKGADGQTRFAKASWSFLPFWFRQFQLALRALRLETQQNPLLNGTDQKPPVA